jgi:hypothetical protein
MSRIQGRISRIKNRIGGGIKGIVRRPRLALLAVIAAALVCALPGGTALATSPSTQHYSKAWTFKSAKTGFCVVFEVIGNITYTEVTSGAPHAAIFTYSNIVVVAPELTATVEHLVDGNCSGTVSTQLTEAQAWAGYSCSFNPTISVSFPWGISFSAWPTCSSRNQASYSTTYSSSKTGTYTQYNSGNNVGYGTYQVSSTTAGPCYGVHVSGTVWKGSSTSDSYTSGSDSVCI